jgi:hypothetical protein
MEIMPIVPDRTNVGKVQKECLRVRHGGVDPSRVLDAVGGNFGRF